jgi:DNA-binding MarR family transcriptional regulator
VTGLGDDERHILADAAVAAAEARRRAHAARLIGLRVVPAEALAAVAAWPLSSAREIGERLALPAAKTSDALKALRGAGLVEAVQDRNDRRVRRYQLTRAGAERARELAAAHPGVARR